MVLLLVNKKSPLAPSVLALLISISRAGLPPALAIAWCGALRARCVGAADDGCETVESRVVPVDEDTALVGVQQAGDDADERRLAGPVGPDEPDPLAGPQVERQVGEERAVAVALGQPLGTQQDAHAALAAGFGGRSGLSRPDHPIGAGSDPGGV